MVLRPNSETSIEPTTSARPSGESGWPAGFQGCEGNSTLCSVGLSASIHRASPLLVPSHRTTRIRVILSILASTLLLVQAATAGPDESKAIKAFQRAFRVAKGSEPNTSARLATLQALAEYDSEKVAKALVKVFVTVDAEVRAIDAQRHAEGEELQLIVEGRTTGGRFVFSSAAQQARWRQLKLNLVTLRKLVDVRRETLSQIGQVLSERQDPKAVTWMVKTVSGAKKHVLYLKIKIAQAAGGVGVPVLPAILKAIGKAKRPDELAALLTGIGLMGKAAGSGADTVIELLKHKAPIVREHAALALSTICDPKAIEPMIDALGRSFGQSKKRIGAYLEALTRQKHGSSAPTWKRWFAAEGAKYLAGEAQLGGGVPSSRKKTTEENYYFGIPQDGESIIYIIDSSGSMKAEVKLRLPKSKRGSGRRSGGTSAKMEKKPGEKKADKKTTTRLEACKAELIRALGLLEPKTMFNVIWYSELPHQFKLGMVQAKPSTVKVAQDWVRKLQPSGSTNIHDSMQMGFRLTGQIAGADGSMPGPLTGKKQKRAAPDTIFLLSDGSPTLPNGEFDSTEKIIKAVRKWNALKSVVVHCIGIGRGVNERFMKKLATENGGEFKRF